jgi:acetyl-CoA acetyltransferase
VSLQGDGVLFAGVGTTGCLPREVGPSPIGLTTEACMAAVADAGVERTDIDGIVGTTPAANDVARTLGLGNIQFFQNSSPPFGAQVLTAAAAIASGLCTTVLVYHCSLRLPNHSRKAAADPFRRSQRDILRASWSAPSETTGRVESLAMGLGYAAWAGRYASEFSLSRADLATVAISAHTGSLKNPLAAKPGALGLNTYMDAPMLRDPLCLYDMDLPVDCADAFIMTSATRGPRLHHRPVTVEGGSLGLTDCPDEISLRGLDDSAMTVAASALWQQTGLHPGDFDALFLYDGFSVIALWWLECLGFCGVGEGAAWLRDHFNGATQQLELAPGSPVNPHGGSLGEGATQGSGHVREAVTQLRGTAGERQVENVRRALLGIGGPFFNAQTLALSVAD